MAYDKSGRASDGSLDPTRKLVAGIMHMSAIGGAGGLNLRKIGDDLYQTMVTGESHGGWKIKKGGGKSEDKSKPVASRITDIDYSASGKPVEKVARVGSRLAEEESSKMRDGGLVRGAGCAQRGRGRGKMV